MLRFTPRPLQALFMALLLGLALPAAAQTRPSHRGPDPEPHTMLWVGNSLFYYNNSLHGHFDLLVASSGHGASVQGTSATISGAGLDWHDLAALLRPHALRRHEDVGASVIGVEQPTPPFDTVVMMDCSLCAVHPQLQANFQATVRQQVQAARKAGARPVLFMTWADKDKPDMTRVLAEQYTRAGNANDALVIPAGLAFARAMRQRPGLELYQPDKNHPSLAGTYLAACTAYAALYRQSPVGLPYQAGLAPGLAGWLQSVAWDTVQAYWKP